MKRVFRNLGKQVKSRRRHRALRRLAGRATKVGNDDVAKSAVILAPHPDDEVIGCGALIARKVDAGCAVDVVIITDGAATAWPADASRAEKAKLRADEARRASAVLGVAANHLHFWGFEDGRLSKHQHALKARIVDLLDRLEPAELYVTSRLDQHSDHQAAAIAAASAVGSRVLPITLLEYPIWFLTRPPRNVKRDVVAVDAGIYLERKRRAFEAYESRRGFGPLLGQFFQEVELFFPVTRRNTASS